jgi:hypothetical protein
MKKKRWKKPAYSSSSSSSFARPNQKEMNRAPSFLLFFFGVFSFCNQSAHTRKNRTQCGRKIVKTVGKK